MGTNDPVKLFWTGGWDSTFRLLQLVLQDKVVVQPYYLIDPNRQSLRNEISARRAIKDRLFREHPDTQNLVLPTIFCEIGDIAPDEELTEAYLVFRQAKNVDFQYSWITRYCKQNQINDMELCVEGLGRAKEPPERLVFTSFLVPIEGTRAARIADEFKDTVVQTLFQFFRFPIRGYDRQEMEEVARSNGWLDYLYMTWFCHNPVHGRYPCGCCDPCDLTIVQGFGKRIPWWRRFYAGLGLEKVRQAAAKIIRKIYPRFHQWNR